MTAATATDAGKARKALFAACRELGIDDETRKQIQLRVVGKDSTSAMSTGEIGLVLDELKKNHGWAPKRQPKRAGTRPIAPGDQAAKIRALWLALYHLAEIEDPAEAAIDGFARRMTKNVPGRGGAGVDSLRWLDAAAANQVIKALRGWCDLFRRNTENDKTFIQSLAPTIIPVWYWTDANDWAAMADPLDIPTIEIGFLDGTEEPELFVQDNPSVGSMFTADKMTWKIRHIYGGNVTDHRGAVKSVVA